MYELKDSYFAILDTQTLVICGAAFIIAGVGFFFSNSKRIIANEHSTKKHKNDN